VCGSSASSAARASPLAPSTTCVAVSCAASTDTVGSPGVAGAGLRSPSGSSGNEAALPPGGLGGGSGGSLVPLSVPGMGRSVSVGVLSAAVWLSAGAGSSTLCLLAIAAGGGTSGFATERGRTNSVVDGAAVVASPVPPPLAVRANGPSGTNGLCTVPLTGRPPVRSGK
jgi:hypothetical protein